MGVPAAEAQLTSGSGNPALACVSRPDQPVQGTTAGLPPDRRLLTEQAVSELDAHAGRKGPADCIVERHVGGGRENEV